MREVDKGGSWPTVLREIDRQIGESSFYKKLDRLCNLMLLAMGIMIGIMLR
jgi:hypothetical protein